MEVVWTTREHSIRQEITACSRDDKGVELPVRNQNKAINIVLSLNRWTNRMNKPEIGTISLILC